MHFLEPTITPPSFRQRYRKRTSDLDKIPTLGYSAPFLSYLTAYRLNTDGHELLAEGYEKYKPGLFKIAMWNRWFVMATGQELVDDIGKAPEDVLSMRHAMHYFFQTAFTMGSQCTRDPYHIPIIRSQLTRKIASVYNVVHEEVVAAFSSAIPIEGSEWTRLFPQKTVERIICRTSNRVYVGGPACFDENYQELNIEFATNVMRLARKINKFPKILHPIVGPFVSKLSSQLRRQTRYLEPIVEERLRQLRENGDAWEKPNDMLMWLMEAAKGDELSTRNLARRIFAVNFASIHTSSKTFIYVLYELAANPQYLQPLRDEVEAIVAVDGWTKAAISKMRRIDSFVRESQRLHGVNIGTSLYLIPDAVSHDMHIASLRRLALKPFTFSNGITVPAGTIVACNTKAVHHDPANYDRPDTFDPFRFVHLPKEEAAKHQMVNTSTEHLAFGYGVHACPGRFFVSNELKTMLAHVVVTYDVKFEEGQEFPPDRFAGEQVSPGAAAVMFRRRQPAA
ncbi:cytochrome P450 [Artomyces pyxidatus]|uniref:Cytochrome P450 n=1 Tax=Artomyces pyxidatus TaxID=48021 RepID=A0ACB8STZ4_9AGAM|nr:cytochrome P450 [Artomyces pyxidatus]